MNTCIRLFFSVLFNKCHFLHPRATTSSWSYHHHRRRRTDHHERGKSTMNRYPCSCLGAWVLFQIHPNVITVLNHQRSFYSRWQAHLRCVPANRLLQKNGYRCPARRKSPRPPPIRRDTGRPRQCAHGMAGSATVCNGRSVGAPAAAVPPHATTPAASSSTATARKLATLW